MFHFFFQPRFHFYLRIVGAALLACLLWNARAYAGSSDYEPGGRYDFGQTSSPRPSYDFDSSGRGPEERDRDRIESQRRSYLDQQPSRRPSAERQPYWKEQYYIQGPDGRSTLCTPQQNGNVVCQ